MDGIQNANLGSSGEVGATAGPLQLLCAEIGVAASTPLAVRHAAVADALRPYLAIPDLLTGMSCSDSPERYARHLLHAGQDHTVLALVWRLGQMSPVHGHRSWCAFGVHRGYLTEIQFGLGQQGPVPRDCIGRGIGSAGGLTADEDAIHRLANLGTETAISIHVYGARYDRLGEEVNHVWGA